MNSTLVRSGPAAAPSGRAPRPRPSRRARGGLVQDQELRLRGERHRDHDALLHPSRQLVGIPFHHRSRVGDLDRAGHLGRSLVRLRRAHTVKTSATCPPTRIEGFSADPGFWYTIDTVRAWHSRSSRPTGHPVQRTEPRGDASVAGQVPDASRAPPWSCRTPIPRPGRRTRPARPRGTPLAAPGDRSRGRDRPRPARGARAPVSASRCRGTALIVRTPGSRRRRSGSRRPRGSRSRAPGTASSTRSRLIRL